MLTINNQYNKNDTIAAIATPPGRGGIGVLRISGALSAKVSKIFLKKIPKIKHATYLPFYNMKGNLLDQGIVLFFKKPYSLTGEDVLELQAHGAPITLNVLLQEIISIPNIRIANPGEFLERAFINGKIDLIQAEAISDLINARSVQASRSALFALKGDFSKKIHKLLYLIQKLRMNIEMTCDFSEENTHVIDIINMKKNLKKIFLKIKKIQNLSKYSNLLQEGIKIAIIGKPNAGKSSIFNALSGRKSAIVTKIPGTTRDVLHEYININGVSINISDTAGLRVTRDIIENIGIRRALKEVCISDHVLFIVDSSIDSSNDIYKLWPQYKEFALKLNKKIAVIRNKADLSKEPIGIIDNQDYPIITISVNDNSSIDILIKYLKNLKCLQLNEEGYFIAKQRHLYELKITKYHIFQGKKILRENTLELVAEELSAAQKALERILGINLNSNSFLNEIFSNFCIGK
ncbi:5-methylaminomethyl-2-thiouridine-synthesizing GTPase [Wigglesworthia glossinidia endosymbiont of Glossina morsitans morsitans (Yale colony)]|uniref:tRNA modification GTPase MnmE n=1 Tax=Wigglesworthia glossinidia endosymbiont of Glossina morsitans morsitans (Yale colony) TaxID=1142511 RepID=H6Q491_WIGGL|nr:tRNA uridine-5-carboxymethylaminomethyl(34) synthesis GTPase MnmE [Wigglesworthia glossinidia]AFA40874.1 5-methylaminomethyl-2-thiouridine-synthesizing GTPase [Wigglesworthia glossinidia endosymbiont of Glossina morsitans morsitans (Yale colony)]